MFSIPSYTFLASRLWGLIVYVLVILSIFILLWDIFAFDIYTRLGIWSYWALCYFMSLFVFFQLCFFYWIFLPLGAIGGISWLSVIRKFLSSMIVAFFVYWSWVITVDSRMWLAELGLFAFPLDRLYIELFSCISTSPGYERLRFLRSSLAYIVPKYNIDGVCWSILL